ncbi:MAG: aminotransferase class I/II-fold pyridoxal phosphate-dependent enzyme [Firmicutes bacterium]|nr:aminotransferase class I/II-fold pyridoxal phosphate-dependent enzyme [Bacillota bacterium]
MRLPPFKLERYFARYEFRADHMLCGSDCESLTVKELLDLEPGAAESFNRLWLGYTESPGGPGLRAAIAGLYRKIGVEDVLVHTGAEEAIFSFMNVVLEPGDHVIVHYPCYQSLHAVAKALGCEVSKWKAREEDGWELDLEFLNKNIRPNTRAIVINCPHNPTGYLMSRESWQQVIETARANKLYLFSDEVYRFLEYSPEDRLPAAADCYEKAVSLGVMSKSFGLAGLRIGWIATRDHSLMRKLAAFKDYTTICNSGPSEFLAQLALRHRERILDRNLEIIRGNLGILHNFFSDYPHVFDWRAPVAGPIAFPSLKGGVSAEDFSRDLLEKKGVLLLPGTVYDSGRSNFRIGFGRRNLGPGLEKFREYLEQK